MLTFRPGKRFQMKAQNTLLCHSSALLILLAAGCDAGKKQGSATRNKAAVEENDSSRLKSLKERSAQERKLLKQKNSAVTSEQSKEVVQSALEALAKQEDLLQGTNKDSPLIDSADKGKFSAANQVVSAQGRLALLYFLDEPAHRAATMQWLKQNNAEIQFHNSSFGYVEAVLPWKSIAQLIETHGNLGLPATSFLKLEVEDFTTVEKKAQAKASIPLESQEEWSPQRFFGAARGSVAASNGQASENGAWTGPVHSAGYGSKVTEFRMQAAADLGVTPAEIEGQGIKVAVFDAGIDASRSDVYGNRLLQYIVGDEGDWLSAELNLESAYKAQLFLAPGAQGAQGSGGSQQAEAAVAGAGAGGALAMPAGLEDLLNNETLRFVAVSEPDYNFDLNQSGSFYEFALSENEKGESNLKKVPEKIVAAVYKITSGHWQARFKVQ